MFLVFLVDNRNVIFVFEVYCVLLSLVDNWNAKYIFEVFYVLVQFVGSHCKFYF